MLGATLGGKYLLLRLLGAGGMGEVYEARNQNTGRRVAVKVLLPEMARDHAVVERFLREARTATRIRHPNVVDILDLDVDASDGTPFIVLEYLLGESLESWLAAQPGQRMSVGEAMAILAPVLSAMAEAHRLRIVHRDLKPGNIFLTRGADGRFVPKVIDFGIARVEGSHPGERFRTQTGVAIGTPAYMSPEQAAGEADVDAQTDVWALGVMLYEMITGRLPYEAPNVNLLIGKILYESPTPITAFDRTLSPDVVDLIERAVCRDRAARFPSAVEMLEAAAACDWREGATTVMDRADEATRPAMDAATRPLLDGPTRPAMPVAPRAISAPPPAPQVVASSPSLVGWEAQGTPAEAPRAPRSLRLMALVAGGLSLAALALTLAPWSRRGTPPQAVQAPAAVVAPPVSVVVPAVPRVPAPPPPAPVVEAPPVTETLAPVVAAPVAEAPRERAPSPRPAARAPTVAPVRRAAPVVRRAPSATAAPPLFDNAYP